MPWTRLDDGFISHPKVAGLSDAAFRLHVSGLNWSVANLTDGRVSTIGLAIAMPLAKPRVRTRAADELVAAGLWTVNGNGWEIHDFDQYQETKEEVEERRRKWAAKKRGAKAHSPPDSTQDSLMESHMDSTEDSPSESHGASTRPRGRPIPSHPIDPSPPQVNRVTTPREAADLWKHITNSPSIGIKAIERFLTEHPELNPNQLAGFLAWAHKNGCRTTGGWKAWYPAWPKTEEKRPLPDCEICHNRRLVGVLPNGDITAVEDLEANVMRPCVCTQAN